MALEAAIERVTGALGTAIPELVAERWAMRKEFEALRSDDKVISLRPTKPKGQWPTTKPSR
jgi:hypothetical protein